MSRASRWRWGCGIAAIVIPVAAAIGLRVGVGWLGGRSPRLAATGEAVLSPLTGAWLSELLAPLEGGRLLDVHAHLGGSGKGSGCWINPRMESLAHPRDWMRMRLYASAAGVDIEQQDRLWSERMEELARQLPLPSRHLFLAFDYRYKEDGTRDLEHSEFHVPNDWAHGESKRHGVRFGWAASVHPYRKDAVAELQRCHGLGARVVKWIPAAQGMDPASDLCLPFFAEMRRLDMTLLVHVGDEQAVEAAEDRELGNPLRLRVPMGQGVRVLAAHCASLGLSLDLEAAGRPAVPSFDLFLRLMEDPLYEDLLFGEISTLTQINRFAVALPALLARPELHHRLVNGSDWPLPNVNVLYRLQPLAKAGLLQPGDLPGLKEIYEHNPLLFDLALKLAVRSPDSGQGFAARVFLDRPEWGL